MQIHTAHTLKKISGVIPPNSQAGRGDPLPHPPPARPSAVRSRFATVRRPLKISHTPLFKFLDPPLTPIVATNNLNNDEQDGCDYNSLCLQSSQYHVPRNTYIFNLLKAVADVLCITDKQSSPSVRKQSIAFSCSILNFMLCSMQIEAGCVRLSVTTLLQSIDPCMFMVLSTMSPQSTSHLIYQMAEFKAFAFSIYTSHYHEGHALQEFFVRIFELMNFQVWQAICRYSPQQQHILLSVRFELSLIKSK